MSKLDELLAEFEKQAAAHAGGDLIYVRDFQREYDLLRSALREREGMMLALQNIASREPYEANKVACILVNEAKAALAAAEGK